ncbi:prepilin peptidase [Candidatus Woesearchaeota archaeon]|nr:prepilin peptidase [Candidatus Woesearchaeota archaeon]
MADTLWFFLPIIAALGASTSWSDFKEGRIKNKHLLTAVAAGLFVTSALYFSAALAAKSLLLTLANAAVALAIGFLLWILGLWSAGDAKLYAVFALLIPPELISKTSTPLFAPELFINTILPVAAFFVVQLLFKTSLRRKKKALRKALSWKKILMSLFVIFSTSWIAKYIASPEHVVPYYLVAILTVIGISRLVYLLLAEYSLHFFALLAVINIALHKQQILQTRYLASLVAVSGGYLLVRLFLKYLGKHYTTKVNINNLQPGMFLIQAIKKDGNKGYARPKFFLKEKHHDEYLYYPRTQGVTKEEIANIQKLYNTGKLRCNHLRARQTIPFAPFLFAGAIITLLSQGNVIAALMGLV